MTATAYKRSEKLPRGSYFYLQVGHRYYAGEEAVFEEVKEATSTIGAYEKGENFRRGWRGFSWSPTPRKLLTRFKKSGKPKYMQGHQKRPYTWDRETETRTMATGTSTSLLTDDLTKVKQFRRFAQAEAACERLAATYSSFDVKVSVKLHEGV